MRLILQIWTKTKWHNRSSPQAVKFLHPYLSSWTHAPRYSLLLPLLQHCNYYALSTSFTYIYLLMIFQLSTPLPPFKQWLILTNNTHAHLFFTLTTLYIYNISNQRSHPHPNERSYYHWDPCSSSYYSIILYCVILKMYYWWQPAAYGCKLLLLHFSFPHRNYCKLPKLIQLHLYWQYLLQRVFVQHA